MDVPDSLACALCEAIAVVIKDLPPEASLAEPSESETNGIRWVTVDCPNCGWQQQALSPAS
jgi:hypothetical protein